MKRVAYALGACLFGALLLITACDNGGNNGNTGNDSLLVDNHFTAQPMPATLVNGEAFPTDSATINGWVANSAVDSENLETNPNIIGHGWAIWKALTEMTTQTSNNQTLRRFETWYTPADVKAGYKMRDANPAAKLNHVQRSTGDLERFRQHNGTGGIPTQDAGVVGFVKYDPSAADHIFDYNLFYDSTLSGMIKPGQIANIPNFPQSGVALKPVFTPLDSLVMINGDSTYAVPAWPTDGNGGNPNRPYSSNDWNNYVYVTINGSTDAANNVYNIDEFISFKTDAAQAASMKVPTGTYAVLEAMHVTTREITRWTWQTFFWAINPDGPPSPSSATIAGLRGAANLDKAAAHYAMAIAYNMVQPAQNYDNGSGANATSVYAYNPYLEADFDTSIFTSGNDSVRKYYSKESQEVGGFMNRYGMQTNCMACHGQARYVKGLYGGAGQLYLTDQYTPLNAEYYRNHVKLDFTWSIQGNIINNDGTPKR